MAAQRLDELAVNRASGTITDHDTAEMCARELRALAAIDETNPTLRMLAAKADEIQSAGTISVERIEAMAGLVREQAQADDEQSRASW